MPSNKSSQRRRLTQRPESEGWRAQLYDIIFEADSPKGRWFDIGLLIAILASILIVSLETVPSYRSSSTLLSFFERTEWLLTILFTIEYVLRLICVRRPLRYAVSFWGIIDLLSILPSYATLFIGSSSRSFVILRSVRLLRVFRVMKLWRMMNDADELAEAVWKARHKIVVFLSVVLVAVTISGALMYQIETVMTEGATYEDGTPFPESGFTSIPQAMYWAIVTMTTVGYGDVVPQTSAGKLISACLILLGYSLIIVPSTFVSAEIMKESRGEEEPPCENCEASGQRADADYCFRCGIRFES
ncbi:MAG: ion transporter [Rubripirellula sp.]